MKVSRKRIKSFVISLLSDPDFQSRVPSGNCRARLLPCRISMHSIEQSKKGRICLRRSEFGSKQQVASVFKKTLNCVAKVGIGP
jgi:hypothetical protein